MMKHVQLAIIGGGPAGLAAAAAARKAGGEDLLIIERDRELGGILNQCIHAGFGLHTFSRELTGPEYARRFADQVRELNIPYLLNTMVLDLSPDRVLTLTGRETGLVQLDADAVILAMGCRERPRGALNIPGCRPAGIYSAGTAQRLVNMEGLMPGRDVVILGSGDIGLIMARRMTLEGAKVHAVAEVMPYSGGLKRNIVQCLEDFGIPLYLSTTVVDIHGRERLEGVTLAQVDGNRRPIPGTERDIPCDTLLLSVGLLPENELSQQAGVRLDAVTGGAGGGGRSVHLRSRRVRLRQRAACPRSGGLRVPGGGPGRGKRRPVPAGAPAGGQDRPPDGAERRAVHRAPVSGPGGHGGNRHRPVPGGQTLSGRRSGGLSGRTAAAPGA